MYEQVKRMDKHLGGLGEVVPVKSSVTDFHALQFNTQCSFEVESV